MKAIFILCDTMNRRFLSPYADADTALTPGIEALARRGLVFDRHFCGSAPCMPARLDIMTGRLNFLEKPWGAVEPFHQTLQCLLNSRNVHSMLFSDHAHYVITGGEGYTKGFTAWEVFRGQEGDPWCVRPDKTGIRPECPPPGYKGVFSESEKANRARFRAEADYPSVKVMDSAAQWLEDNHEADNFLLWAETFDPHEPYDAPEEYLKLYEDDYTGPDFNHPDYQPNVFTPEETRHLRNRCKALMTMTDRGIQKIVRVMDKYDLWKDTLLIFTTDHGFHLGEHGYMAKNYMAPYNEVFHIPLIVCGPGTAPGRTSALTQSVDLMPTVAEYFGVDMGRMHYPLHGRSLLPLLRGEVASARSEAIFGYFGKQVCWTDGKYVYFRAARDESNRPLNVYTAIPSVLRQYFGADDGLNASEYDKIEMGRFLPWTRYPVYRFPADCIHFHNPSQEFGARSPFNRETLLFDIENDYAQEHPLEDEPLKDWAAARLAQAMRAHDALPEQLVRLGLDQIS